MALWDACLGTSQGPGPPDVPIVLTSQCCLGGSGVCVWATYHVSMCETMKGCTHVCSKHESLSLLVRLGARGCMFIVFVTGSSGRCRGPESNCSTQVPNQAGQMLPPAGQASVSTLGAMATGGGFSHRSCMACSCQFLNRLEPWWVSKCHERQHPKGM